MRWKLIDTYGPGPYRGYDEKVLLGWDSGHPEGIIMFFGVGYLSDGKWHDVSDKKPWPNQPSHWLMECHGFPQDFSPQFSELA